MKKTLFILPAIILVSIFACIKNKQLETPSQKSKSNESLDAVIPNGITTYTAAISLNTKSVMTIDKTSTSCTIVTSNSARSAEKFSVISVDLAYSGNSFTVPGGTDYWFIPFDGTQTPVKIALAATGTTYTVTCSCPDASGNCTPEFTISTNSVSCIGLAPTPCSCCSTITTNSISTFYGSGVIVELASFTFNGVSY